MEKVLFLLMAFMSLAITADCQNRVTVHPDGRIEYEGEGGNRITRLGKSEVIDHSALDVVYQHIIKAPTYSEPRSISDKYNGLNKDNQQRFRKIVCTLARAQCRQRIYVH